jgi:hypothetical protein
MLSIESGNLIAIATIVGFVGDALLQVVSKKVGGSGWGLKQYFIQHGSVESTFIAGGMLGLFYIIYAVFNASLGLPFNIITMAIYGVLLDLLFRVTGLFPSLDGYYRNLSYVSSAIWGAIPMMIPIIIYQLSTNTFKIW